MWVPLPPRPELGGPPLAVLRDRRNGLNQGVGDDGYALARSSGGRMWAAWIEAVSETSVDYALVNGQCEGLIDASYDVVLHVDYVHEGAGRWGVNMTAFGDMLTLTVQTRNYRYGLDIPPEFRAARRILSFDTNLI